MSLDSISLDSEKLIWEYYHELNKVTKKIIKILNYDYKDEYIIILSNENYNINLLDIIEYFSNNYENLDIYERLISVRIINKKNDKYFNISKDNVKEIIKNNKDILDVNILQVVKLYKSYSLYILVKK